MIRFLLLSFVLMISCQRDTEIKKETIKLSVTKKYLTTGRKLVIEGITNLLPDQEINVSITRKPDDKFEEHIVFGSLNVYKDNKFQIISEDQIFFGNHDIEIYKFIDTENGRERKIILKDVYSNGTDEEIKGFESEVLEKYSNLLNRMKTICNDGNNMAKLQLKTPKSFSEEIKFLKSKTYQDMLNVQKENMVKYESLIKEFDKLEYDFPKIKCIQDLNTIDIYFLQTCTYLNQLDKDTEQKRLKCDLLLSEMEKCL